MPELPEVETIRKNLDILIKNKKIVKILILRDGIVCAKKQFFCRSLIKQQIESIERFGKWLVFILSNNQVLLTHLRMEGKYIFSKNHKNISKYARIVFFFKSGEILNYDDSRMFGKMYIKNKNDYLSTPPLSLLGPEAIQKININNFYHSIKKKHRCIKSVLLDQKIISGIGNIYATEILFASNISPLKKCNELNIKQIKTILENAKKILLLAIKKHGCSTSSFVNSHNQKGKYQNFLQIYGKIKQPCPKCGTILSKQKICGRGTMYCRHCQI